MKRAKKRASYATLGAAVLTAVDRCARDSAAAHLAGQHLPDDSAAVAYC